MKIIGLIGGTGWVSTLEYYRIMNEETNKRLGGHQFANCIIYSLNYGDIANYNKTNNKQGIYELILSAAEKLQSAGAQGLLLCANTLHQFAEALQQQLNIPVIHIAEATASEINAVGISTVGLLGTRQTMEMDFYKSIFMKHKINTLIPESEDREYIQTVINNELIKSIFKSESRMRFQKICENLIAQGAQGIVLGCTEIPLLMKQEDISVKAFDTLEIHAKAAVDFAINV